MHSRLCRGVGVLARVCSFFLACLSAEADWPSWRGSNQGVAPGAANQAITSIKVAWKTRLAGFGRSSPVVKGNMVVVSSIGPERSGALGLALSALAAASIAITVWLGRQSQSAVPVGVLLASLAAPLFLVADFEQTLRFWPPRILSLPARYWTAGLFYALVAALSFRFYEWRSTPLAQLFVLSSLTCAVAVAMFPGAYFSGLPDFQVWVRFGAAALFGLGGALLLAVEWPLHWRAVGITVATAWFILMTPLSVYGHPAPWEFRCILLCPLASFAVLCCMRSKPVSFGSWSVGLTIAVAVGIVAFAHERPSNFNDHQLLFHAADDGRHVLTTSVRRRPAIRFTDQRASGATPTPLIAGDRVIVQFDGLVAAVGLDGNVIWAAEQAVPPENVVYGVGSSPVLAGDQVIVVQERERLEKTTANVGGLNAYPSWIEGRSHLDGRLRWHRDLPSGCCTYSTPAVDGTGRILVVSGDRFLVLSPLDGRILSEMSLPLWELCSSMVIDETDTYIAGGSVRAGIFRISLASIVPAITWQKGAHSAGCASPLLLNGVVYIVSHNGIATAVDSTNGRTLWRGRLPYGEYYASLVSVGKAIIAISSDGTLSVFDAGPAFNLAASVQLDEPVIASPAVSGGRAFARGDRSLYALEFSDARDPSKPDRETKRHATETQ